MKKMLFGAMMLATLAATKTNAQLRDNLSFGPLVGFGHSWITDVEGLKFHPSFNGGARLVYSATPHFGFGLDGTFRTEGYKAQTSISKTTGNLNYINLDPKLYYFFGKYGQAIRPKIGVGPNFGFLVGGKVKNSPVSGPGSADLKAKDFFAGFDFGLSGVLGFNYRIKSGTWLNVDAVYNNGFSDLTKANTTSLESRSLFLNVGVTFGIGHVESKADQRKTNTRKR